VSPQVWETISCWAVPNLSEVLQPSYLTSKRMRAIKGACNQCKLQALLSKIATTKCGQ
jgi:hypothetical protein